MPKDEHRPRKSRDGLDHVPYTKHPTTHPGEGHSSLSDSTDSREPDLSLVLKDAAGPSSASAPNAEVIPPIGPTAPRSSQSLGSFFQMSRNVNVNGGEFTSSQLHHTNLTINISSNAGSADSVELSGMCVPERESVHGRQNGRSVGPAISRRMEEDAEPVSTSEHAPVEAPRQENHPTMSLPVQKSSEIYFRHLAAKGRGSPLWIPEPNNMLPTEYRRRGVGIGDVGIITDSGGFDFLFNICLPVGDPINPDTMPEDFKPLPYPESRDIYANLEFKAESYLASSLVETSRRDGGDSPGLFFESSAMDGAVLTMPTGSRSMDLRNVTAFRKYALANAEKWYQYANEVRGREARNGDLRLVVGYNSASAWGMAAFANLSKQNAFRLRFSRHRIAHTTETENDWPSSTTAYGWECSGTAVEVKSGPDRCEVELLQEIIADESGRLDEQQGPDSGRNVHENQCLFIRTINVTLQDAVWNRLSASWKMDMALDDDVFPASDDMNASLASSTRTGNSVHQDGDPIDHSFTNNRVHLSSLPGALNVHPSTVINGCLLKERPGMRMAITEDTDWISVIDSDETILPKAEILFSRIMSTHEICEDNGAVFFMPSDLESVPPSTPPPLSERILNYPESLSRLVDPHLLPMLSSINEESAQSPSSTSPSHQSSIRRRVSPEHAYPTPLVYDPRRNLGLLSSNASSTIIQPEPTPADTSVSFPQRSGSHPPSTPPLQTSSGQIAEILNSLDPETLYPTPETVPLRLRR